MQCLWSAQMCAIAVQVAKKKKNTYGCWEVGWVIHYGLNCRLLQDGRASVFLLFEPMVQQGARVSLWSLGATTANAAARCEA